MKQTLSTILGAGLIAVSLTFGAAAQGTDSVPETNSFLNDLAGAGRYEKSCAQNGMNGVVFSDTLNGKRFIPYSDVEKFLHDAYGKPDYGDARFEFQKAKDDFWRKVTHSRMGGGSFPNCGM